MASAGDVDRISALPDELLHLILTFVCEAKAVTRTAVLSRRWRRVCIHAQHPVFLDSSFKRGTEPDRFVGFVDRVLAQRGEADIAYLRISMSRDYDSSWLASPELVNEWLRYATRRVVGTFHLHLPYRSRFTLSGADEPAVVLPDDHGRITSMALFLSRHRLQLPVAPKYETHGELSLCSVTFFGAGRTLGDFVSSCCPRLRKLGISIAKGLPQLALRSEALQELKLYSAGPLRILDVAAPNLRALKLEHCFGDWSDEDDEHDVVHDFVVRIAAPRLQEIGITQFSHSRHPDLDIHDLTSVRRLSRLRLNMHGQYCAPATDVGFWFLKNCPGAEHVAVCCLIIPVSPTVVRLLI